MNDLDNNITRYKDYRLDKRTNPLDILIIYLNTNGFNTIKGNASQAPLDISKDGAPVVRITFLYDNQLTTAGADYSSLKHLAKDEYQLEYFYLNQRYYQIDVYQYIDSDLNYVKSGYEQVAIDIKGLLLSPYSINYFKKHKFYLSDLSINVTSMSEIHDNGHYLHRSILNFSIIYPERIVVNDSKTKCVHLDLHKIGAGIE